MKIWQTDLIKNSYNITINRNFKELECKTIWKIQP
jgi:hypothetical protein